MQMRNRKILVTGGTSGIGHELVTQLHGRGNSVIVLARSANRLDEMAAAYENIFTYRCDMSKRQEVETVIGTVMAEHPDISVLINNAGVQFTPTFIADDFNHDNIGYEITTNLTAPLWLVSLLLPAVLMDRDESMIVNVSSGLAFYPKTSSAVYSATKAALHSVSQSLRYQLEKTPVRVAEVILPLVDTPMTTGRGRGKISPHQAAREIIDGMEQGRDEIYVGKARALPFLLRIAPGVVRKMLKGE